MNGENISPLGIPQQLIFINRQLHQTTILLQYTVESGKTCRYRVCNIGLKTSINFRVQGHPLKLVEIEGSHTVQNVYDSVDVHVGQCMSVLVTANQEPKDFYMVVSSRFTKTPIQSVAITRYANGKVGSASPALPPPPPEGSAGIAWSNNQFRSFRWNLTASAARPNPHGSYHYGRINITRSIKLFNSQSQVDDKLRFAVNRVSHVEPIDGTPVKLLEYFGVKGQFEYNLMKDEPSAAPKINVVNTTWRSFVEIIFENTEKTIQTWHLDGYSFFAVAIEQGKWSPAKRNNYNLIDAVSRHDINVYPNSWAAVMLTLDNAGMLNLRSEIWERAYLGQQLYVSSLSPEFCLRDEYNHPEPQQVCGLVKNMQRINKYSGF